MNRRVLVWALACSGLGIACAVSVPPSGGPEDRTAPEVTATIPAGDSAGVAPDTEIRIAFNEGMTRRSFERYIEFSPHVPVARVDWDGNTAVVRLEGTLHPDTTYVVTLKPGYQDQHRVAAKEAIRFAFATSAAIDSGRVAGRVLFRREPTPNGVVYGYVPRDTVFDPESMRPDRVARADEDGRYALDYLGTGGQRYILWAFEDRNADGSFTPSQDVGYAATDTVTLTPGSPTAIADIAIIDPEEPAVVSGRVINETGIDTLLVSVALWQASDSLRPSYYTLCDTTGRYELNTVLMGRYALRAFVDVKRDSVCAGYPCGPDSTETCFEPCAVHPDSVAVAPGDELKMDPIELRSGDRQ